ncbi:hypothetical protein KOR42_13420 [Thalassoglobus neptunius]|uniref:Uncharacterized protein n=1 Tax=Thalassoglobus neptunius TaxID=1938619 RepID=A0A5C5X4R4_9PLAN|nr:hypothetical protein [Thalassoglobus neptunius]TWT57974.1 hypothetical protein KOR42_13420 [Thalassoglobus neptunius]
MIDEMLGKTVVLDMSSPYVFIGTLQAADELFLVLVDVDVHDLRDSSTNRETYVHEARVHGLTPNRARTVVSRNQIVSMSLLGEVHAE